MVKTKNLTLMVTAAVLAALTCVATMVVQIPMPLTKGYVNLGDVMVLTSVWLIGSPWGVAAAGIGSACFMNGSYFRSIVGKVIGGVAAEIIMVAGYFVYAVILYGNVATAAAGILGNAIQGAVGLIAGVLLTVALEKAGTKKLLGFDK